MHKFWVEENTGRPGKKKIRPGAFRRRGFAGAVVLGLICMGIFAVESIEPWQEPPTWESRTQESRTQEPQAPVENSGSFCPESLLEVCFSQNPYVEINGNTPYFSEEDCLRGEFEAYSELDSLGRCGVAFANISPVTMPSEEREGIGQIKPSGWHTVKYPEVIPDNYLYNRCHLIAFSLAGENANEKNLITGTRYLNVQGMLPFELQVANYVSETGNHVLYRVTPIFEDNDLVARGVLMEAYSIEDEGRGVCFCVYCFNVQPGIEIDYSTGESWLRE